MPGHSQDRAETSGTKRATLADVARHAGVSTSTVSIAFSKGGPISERMRSRVIESATQLGYAGPDPRAASLRRGRSGLIGVVLGERLGGAFRDPIRIALLDGIADAVGNAGSGLALLGDTDGGPLNIATAPVDAVILFGCSTRFDESFELVRQRGLPMVELEGAEFEGAEFHEPGTPIPHGIYVLDSDNRGAAKLGAEHLRNLGHTNVSIVSLPLDRDRARHRFSARDPLPGHSFVADERIRGVRDVFPAAGGYSAASSLVEEGRLAGRVVLGGSADNEHPLDRSLRPTAVIAQSDLLAVGVIRAAAELGLHVPNDVSVLGFDGIPLEGLAELDLSTLVQPAQAKGRAAGLAALDLIEGRQVSPQSFHSVLHEGATTGQAPAPR